MGLKSFLFGGGGPKPYTSKNTGKYETETYDLINQRRKNPLAGPEGIEKATAGYDFNPTNEAIQGYRGLNYTPRKFDFAGLPEQYATTAYSTGARNIRREASGNLDQLRESVGSRRPGLIAKLGQDANRDTEEHLADLNSKIQLNKMQQDVDLGRDQQKSQADEDYRGAQFRGETLNNLSRLGLDKIGTQSGILNNEREYQDELIKYLMNLYQTSAGITNNAASMKKGGGGLLGNIAKIGGAVAGGMFGGPGGAAAGGSIGSALGKI
jgi:hypothetical protein